jgi:hypothetical protein
MWFIDGLAKNSDSHLAFFCLVKFCWHYSGHYLSGAEKTEKALTHCFSYFYYNDLLKHPPKTTHPPDITPFHNHGT